MRIRSWQALALALLLLVVVGGYAIATGWVSVDRIAAKILIGEMYTALREHRGDSHAAFGVLDRQLRGR